MLIHRAALALLLGLVAVACEHARADSATNAATNTATRSSTRSDTAAPAAIGGDPSAILGDSLVLWLDSEVGVTLDPAVEVWADQSAQGNDVSAPGTQPTVVTNQADGFDVIRFASTIAPLTRIDGFTGMASGDSPYFYAVISSGSGSDSYSHGYFEVSDNSAPNRCAALMHETTAIKVRRGNGALVDADFVDGVTTSEIKLVVARFVGTTLFLDIDGANVDSSTITEGLARTPNDLVVGSLFSAYAGFFDAYEIVFANPAPSAGQHTALMAYFSAKYPSLP